MKGYLEKRSYPLTKPDLSPSENVQCGFRGTDTWCTRAETRGDSISSSRGGSSCNTAHATCSNCHRWPTTRVYRLHQSRKTRLERGVQPTRCGAINRCPPPVPCFAAPRTRLSAVLFSHPAEIGKVLAVVAQNVVRCIGPIVVSCSHHGNGQRVCSCFCAVIFVLDNFELILAL